MNLRMRLKSMVILLAASLLTANAQESGKPELHITLEKAIELAVSDNPTMKVAEKEIELKKMSMVEKDLESKRLMENPIPLPKEQQEALSAIRQSTSELMNDVGYKHTEINERLARLEAQTEQKKLEKMLKDIEEKEKRLQKQ